MAKVVGEREVSRERVGERMVELENIDQVVSADDVKVTVRERSHVRHRLADRLLLPELITEHVSPACSRRQTT